MDMRTVSAPEPKPLSLDEISIARLPGWVRGAVGDDRDTVAFVAGAALALVDQALRGAPGGQGPGSHALLRDRLALRAAFASLRLAGRRADEGELRDALAFARPGEALGPVGEVGAAWRRFVELRMSVTKSGEMNGTAAQFEIVLPDLHLELLERAGSDMSPVSRALGALRQALEIAPEEESAALMLSDLVLARALGWDRVVPLIGPAVTAADLRALRDGDAAPLTRAVVKSCDAVLRLNTDVTRRVARLRAVAPKLRSKSAGPALGMFLRRDCVAPAQLQGRPVGFSKSGAIRFCDRLIVLGVVREMSGRDVARVYGI